MTSGSRAKELRRNAQANGSPGGLDLPDAIDRIRPSVVQIAVRVGHQFPVLGTGFLVSRKGYVLTARHVVDCWEQFPGAECLVIGLAMPNVDSPDHGSIRHSYEVITTDVAEQDARHDLALLRPQANPFSSGKTSGLVRTPNGLEINAMFGLAAMDSHRPRDGERVAVSGYPLQIPTLITTSGAIASPWGVDMKETQPPGAPDGFTMPDMKDSYIADVAVNPGNSGGPVYKVATGEVIGVCVSFRVADAMRESSVLSYNSGLTIVVPIKYGQELLARHD